MNKTRLLRVVLLVTSFLTLFLVGLGGFVRGTGAGLSCPDWPLCFGRVIPPTFAGGVAQEWIHRILAKSVGVLCIASTILAYRVRRQHPRAFRFTLAMLALVIVQGIFGGLTVLMLLNPFVVTTHLALGTLFFQATVLVALEPSYRVEANEPRQILYHPMIRERSRRFSWGLLALAVLIFCQMILGGFVGSSGASLACPQLPICQLVGDDGTTSSVGAKLCILSHALLGTAILLLSGWLALQAFFSRSGIFLKRHHLAGVFGLITLQVALGLTTVHLQIPVAAAVTHLVLAQLILLGVTSCYRSLNPGFRIFESVEELPEVLRHRDHRSPVRVSAAG